MPQKTPDARGPGPARTDTTVESVRPSDWLLLAFLFYSATAATLFHLAPEVTSRIVILNLAISLGYFCLIYFESRGKFAALSYARDWTPLGVLIFIYQEMGWFAQPHAEHRMELVFVRWDRAFLHGGASAVIESLGPVLPSTLEICYALVYAIPPFSLALLYLYRRRKRAEYLLFTVLVGVLLCYGQFPFWPSEPPRTVFAGQDLPAYDTVFRRFNLWTLAHAGIHTSVFPSAHVAAAFSAAWAMRKILPEHKWAGWFLLGMAIVIALATVYGRYHYMADAGAGFAMSIGAFRVTVLIEPSIRRACGEK